MSGAPLVRRSIAGVLLTALALAALPSGCASGRKLRGSGGRAVYGVYKGRLIRAREKPISFRMLVYAATPDRFHAEVLPPVGGPQLILDGGEGRLAVTMPSRRTAWVGGSAPGALSGLLGADVGLADLVAFILDGTPPGVELNWTRDPERGAGLPRRFEVGPPDQRLSLRLKGRRELAGDPARLATGTPPPGMEIRSLDELAELDLPSLLGVPDEPAGDGAS